MIYTITILSINKLPNSGSNGDAIYNINWSFLPDNCDYKISFSFISKQEATAGNSVMNQVYLISSPDLGSRQSYIAGKTTTTVSSNEIGAIYPYAIQVSAAQTGTITNNTAPTANTTTQTIGFNTYYGFKAAASDNVPIYMRGRPTSNQFTVQIYAIDKSFIHAMSADYALTINFEKV